MEDSSVFRINSDGIMLPPDGYSLTSGDACVAALEGGSAQLDTYYAVQKACAVEAGRVLLGEPEQGNTQYREAVVGPICIPPGLYVPGV